MSKDENNVDILSSIINDILVCKNIEEELTLLENVHRNITKFDETYRELNLKDTNLSKTLTIVQGYNFENLITYVFVRRFGWSEGVKLETTNNLISLTIGVLEIKAISKSKKENLDQELDTIIDWLTRQPICPALIRSYIILVNKVSSLPIVRNRSIVHILSWLQGKVTPSCDDTVVSLVNDLLLLSLTDVWSAIRKVSSSRLGVILDAVSSHHQVVLWNKLVEICEEPGNSWQKTDGAILGICAIVQHYHALKGSTSKCQEAPDFMKQDLVRVVFGVISHSQLPIREAAVRAITAYITLIDSQECLEILELTLKHLKGGDKALDDETDHFVDAYMAEGLLNICQSLIKTLPMSTLLPRMKEYLSVFLLHLAHPASSVRQSASCIFKLLVQKSSDSVSLITNILYLLTKGWTPNLEERVPDKGEMSWQGREGRMFAFEIICTFLIKNHIKTMFNSRKPHKREDSLNTSEQSCSGPSKVLTGQSSVDLISPCSLSVIAQMRLQDHQQRDKSHETKNKQDSFERYDVPRSCTLLTTILYQTVDCLADNQWELRRIAQQVLPCLAEVVRWFDCALLQHIWETHLSSDSSLTTYMSLFLLKESLYHCIRLEPLLQNTADHTFKTADLTDSVRCILESVTRNTARYLPATDLLLARHCFDKLSVLAAEIIIMAHQLFDIDSQQKQSQSSLLKFWKKLFVFAHPSSRITRDLLDSPDAPFSSPYDGYLSCCLVKPEGDSQCARQVEKVFVKTVCGHLQVYLSCLPWTDVAGYLPLLMYNIGLIIDDPHMCKTLLRCVSSQSRRVVDKVLTEESTERQLSLRCVYFCLREAAGIVAMKSLDSQLLLKVLHIYLVLCQAIHPSRHLKMIFRGICVRLCKTSPTPECMDLSPRPDVDVSLLWQESPVLLNFSEGSGEEQEEEEEDIFAGGDLPAFYSECLSLNVSSSSGQFLTGRSRTLSTQSSVSEGEAAGTEGDGEEEEEEESDDWDSWSEEEQDDGSLNEMFAVFLTNLKQVLGQDGSTIFHEEAECLKDEEKQIIRRLTTK